MACWSTKVVKKVVKIYLILANHFWKTAPDFDILCWYVTMDNIQRVPDALQKGLNNWNLVWPITNAISETVTVVVYWPCVYSSVPIQSIFRHTKELQNDSFEKAFLAYLSKPFIWQKWVNESEECATNKGSVSFL